MRPIYNLLQELNIPGKTVVAAPLTAFGARIAQEKLGIPLCHDTFTTSRFSQHVRYTLPPADADRFTHSTLA